MTIIRYDKEEGLERPELYTLLASLFTASPTVEVLRQIAGVFGLEAKETFYSLESDFRSLFPVPGGKIPPCESLYNYGIGDRPGLQGKAAEEVSAFYLSAGLLLDEGAGLVPDHLSSELIFMGYLAENGLVEEQLTFFEEHLLEWVPEYCVEIKRYAATSFYREVANLLEEFILSDYEELSGSV